MKISFCTTCMGRLFQLEQTLPMNLESMSRYDDVEFAILNYNSPDGLHEWIQKHYMQHIATGRIRYAINPEPVLFHSSKAKNQAHRLATGDVLVNLDADNFIGRSYDIIKTVFTQDQKTVLHMFSGFPRDGTCGRVALHKEYYYKLGGYDESFLPTGSQDIDLIERAKAYGLNYIWIRDKRIGRAIRNSRELKMKYTGYVVEDYEKHIKTNRDKMAQNINAGRLVANSGMSWGKASRLTVLSE